MLYYENTERFRNLKLDSCLHCLNELNKMIHFEMRFNKEEEKEKEKDKEKEEEEEKEKEEEEEE